jgi:DNA-binding transcriptional LysR family regulator
MNDRHLKYIIAIAETGSITTASKKLYISQPSLSNLLSSVEKELGAPLFERSPLGLVPTYAGECYIDTAKRILNDIRNMELKIGDAQKQETGSFSIGCGRTLSSRLFPIIIPHFRKLHPGYKIELFEDSISVLHTMLISGRLDIAITYAHIDSMDTTHIPLYRQEIVLLAPSSLKISHTQGADGSLPEIDLSSEKIALCPFVVFKRGNHLRTVIDRIFQDYRVSPDIILETNNWQTCAEMVKQKEALSILTYNDPMFLNSMWYYEDMVRFYRFDKGYSRDISIYYKKSEYTPAIIRSFIDFSKEIILNRSLQGQLSM